MCGARYTSADRKRNDRKPAGGKNRWDKTRGVCASVFGREASSCVCMCVDARARRNRLGVFFYIYFIFFIFFFTVRPTEVTTGNAFGPWHGMRVRVRGKHTNKKKKQNKIRNGQKKKTVDSIWALCAFVRTHRRAITGDAGRWCRAAIRSVDDTGAAARSGSGARQGLYCYYYYCRYYRRRRAVVVRVPRGP